MTGDQFTIVALPWLALKLSGDPVQLGIVLSLAALPRALFILFGGALVDIYNPQKVLVVCKLISAIILAVIIHSIWAQWLTMEFLYVLTLIFGTSIAIALPAAQSIVPMIVEKEQITTANSAQMSTQQLTGIFGPMLAGFVIALNTPGDEAASFADSSDYTLLLGSAMAFSVTAFCHLFYAFFIAFKVKTQSIENKARESVRDIFGNIYGGLKYVFGAKDLRSLMLYFMMTGVFVNGVIQISIPLIADANVEYGAKLMGWLLTCYGLGSILGMIISGVKPNLTIVSLGLTIAVLDIFVGGVLAIYGNVSSHVLASLACLFAIGLAMGTIQVKVFSWAQARVEKAYLGRTMSIMTFISLGLSSLSPLFAGLLLKYVSIQFLLMIVGGCIAVSAGIGYFAFNMINVGRKTPLEDIAKSEQKDENLLEEKQPDTDFTDEKQAEKPLSN